MANPTSNFGWQMPTPTDLVTDLPADFEVFGQAVDTSLADLKGGTTGQVLAKNSNTDMDFVWSSPNPGDITAVTAGTGISGGGTSGDVTITNSMATAIDAKGDLIAGTGADTFSRLAAGSNGETLVADSSTATGLRYSANYAAGKNTIINGAFNVWQRGTSFSVTTAVYTADRFRCSADTTTTFSQQAFTAGTAPVAGYEGTFFLRAATGAGTSYVDVSQPIEDVRTFAGQTATLSFWAKANSATTLVSFFRQSFGSGGSANVDTTGSSSSLTTSWQRFTFTVAIPSVSGKTIGAGSFLMPVLYCNSGAASKSIDIWGVQFEAGSVATAFQTATGTIQGELAACQRYYRRLNAGVAYGSFKCVGTCTSTTKAEMVVSLDIEMRVNPSFASSGSFQVINGSSNTGVTSLASGQLNSTSPSIDANVASGLTAGFGAYLRSNNSTASYLEFSAEL